MDNKQNRQFYWEVKDFFAGKALNESKKSVSKPNILRDIKNVMNSVKPLSETEKREAFRGYSQISNEVKNKTSQMLNAYNEKINVEKPFSKGNAANYTTNLFNLNEQLAASTMGSGNNLGSSTLSRTKNKKDIQLTTSTINPTATSSALTSETSMQSPMDISSSFRSLNLNFGQMPRTNVVQGIKTTISTPDEPLSQNSPSINPDERMYQGMNKEEAIEKLTANMLKPRKERNEAPQSEIMTNPDGTQVSVLTNKPKTKSSFRV
jgi:hypothetical protein